MGSPYANKPRGQQPQQQPDKKLEYLMPMSSDALDLRHKAQDIPTPPWMIRALCEHILGGRANVSRYTCLEPACGLMYAADTLWEYFGSVRASDKLNWGCGDIVDFTDANTYKDNEFDWVITNPPFAHVPAFAKQAYRIAKRGVAMLVSIDYLGGEERYKELYSVMPPSFIAVHPERPGTAASRTRHASGETKYYCWLVWNKCNDPNVRNVNFIPLCREQLSKPDFDYAIRFSKLFPTTDEVSLNAELRDAAEDRKSKARSTRKKQSA